MQARSLSYEFGAFRLDAVEKTLSADGRPVPLTPKAIETLLALVERHGHLVTKDELFQKVWPDTFVEENNLAQNISQLRRVLGEGLNGGRFIETVPTRGYRFVAPVRELIEGEPAAPPPPIGQPNQEPAKSSDIERPSGYPGRIPSAKLWGFAAAACLTIAVLASSRMRESTAAEGEVARAASAAAAAVDARGRGPLPRIAVLPFLNLGSPGDEYFAAG
jgi:DNA-binding winged helix-turn-helix (wHTH) protein